MDDSNLRIPVSIFENKDDRHPRRHEMAWHAFAERLYRYDERPTKDGKAWSPVTYLPDTTRGKANVDEVFALVLDIDYGPLPLDLIERYEYVAHTTFQHTPEAPRWRVTLPLSRPVRGADWPGFWLRANAFFGGCVDPATKDASRIFYLPSCPPGAQHEVKQQHGDLLDPDSLPDVPAYVPQPVLRGGHKRSVLKQGLADWAARFALNQVDKLAGMPPDSGRNAACNRTAHTLAGLAANPVHDLRVEWITDQILDACHRNGLVADDGQRSVYATIRSGLDSGELKPWSPADQEPIAISSRLGPRQQKQQAEPEEGLRLNVIPMTEVEPESISWLWRGWLARGKITILMGDPGLGKSLITHWLAARISVGGEWPDRDSAEQGNVILFTLEDDRADTVKPRLMAAGADMQRVFVVTGLVDRESSLAERMFTLEEHIAQLTEAVKQYRPSLLIFDPITQYLGAGVNSNRETDVRRVLGPLAQMAQETGVALLLLMHLNKGSGTTALYRAAGSIAFTAVARVVLGVASDPNDEDNKRRLLLPLKLSIGQLHDGLSYRIETATTRILRAADEDQPPVLLWDKEPVSIDATLAMDHGGAIAERNATEQVVYALLEIFRNRQSPRIPSSEIHRQLKDAGLSTSGSILTSAKKQLSIRSIQDRANSFWYWVIPDSKLMSPRADARGDSVTESVVTLDTTDGADTPPSNPSSLSSPSTVSTDSVSLARARDTSQEMRYCPACTSNLTEQVYEEHICSKHGQCFAAHDCDEL